jgi:hypothetical protein
MVFARTRERIAKMINVSWANIKNILRSNMHIPEVPRQTEFYHRCVDITQPQGICCCLGPPWTQG